MMAQGMRTNDIGTEQGLVSMANAAGSKRTGQTNGFQDVMNRNLGQDKRESNKVSDRQTTKKSDSKYDAVQNPKNTDVEKVPEKTKEVSKAANGTEDNLDAGTVEEVITEQISKIVQKLQDVLELSAEELAELMMQLGLGAADLCNQDNLMKLVLKASGSEDVSSILTDEKLGGQMKELLATLQEVSGVLADNQITGEDVNQWQDQWKSIEAGQSETETNPKNQNVTENSLNTEEIKSGEKLQTEPLVEVLHQGEAAKIQKNADTNAKSERLPNEIPPEETVQNVQAEDAGTSQENDLLEKQANGVKKEDSQTTVKTEEPKSKFEAFMTQLGQNSKTVETVLGQNGQVTTVREIVNQVVSKIRMVIQPDMTSMELQLNPENLGKVHLSVTAREGEMTAQFMVQNETAKAALESQIQVLRENLNNQGLKVEAIEVTVSDFSFSQSNGSGEAADSKESNQNHSRRQMNLDEMNGLEADLSDEETMAVNMMKQNGGSIDYTA